MAEDKQGRRKKRTLSREAHWAEWTTGVLCTLLVLAMTGWIGYEAMSSTGDTPALTVRIIRQQTTAGGHQVSFVVENSGKRTAAAVPVTGTLSDGDRIIETREVIFDYVPEQSSASGTLLFKDDPAAHRFDLRASGYTDP
ncbi:MAG TPA: TIGR02588 family protein [Pararhizobium sp.]|uniref:TIGR02588 family protein n=1 Tax=Pararhizobium sp. TaxID=1977563 RepID=UPI002BF3C9A2|nr:TIGR02588 family protein [Pararhizobium sp.]HTO29772.1 TIGR02588 family protein [Pararhizobium sp.]